MVLGKLFRIYHKCDKNKVYSVLLENKNDKSETLLFESGAVGVLSSTETDSVKPLYSIHSDVYGCLGTLNLSIGEENLIYLVCVSSCVSVGKIQSSEIFCVSETSFIPLRNNPSDLERIQDVRKILNSGSFYFSWSSNSQNNFDLTLCAQKSERTKDTDNRFFWNRMLYLHMKSFDVNTEKWLFKVMCGGISISTVYVGHQQAKACLISRLSCERAGTRFNVRGTNDNGHVANFVETEQVIFADEKVSSFILIRGSIPLFWEQTGVQVGAHKLKMSRGFEISQPAFDRHLALIQYLYGKQVLVNLVANKDGEFMIGSMYKLHFKNSQFQKDLVYIDFDYHHHCPRGKEDKLSILKDHIKKYYEEFSFYYSVNKTYQKGTFRVNCIDCLDRTNRVQTFIGLEILMKQLQVMELDTKTTIVSRFQEVYKNMWQSNGDQISRIYAGTGALEGRSKLRDGTLSVARTIQNNLLDNSKQEAIDILLTGKPLNNESGDRARSLLPLQYLHMPSSILKPLTEDFFEYTFPNKITIAVGTWNVNGGKHFNSIIYKKSDPLSDWLLDANKNRSNLNVKNLLDLSHDDSLTDINANSPDLFAIGFEEIVDLSAQNIVATSTTSQKEWLTELEKTLSRNERYVLVTSIQLVGVCLFLFIKPKFALHIRDVATDQIKTGLGGAAGNKGGVGIRMRLFSTSLCFICSHFAAGQSQFAERNSDYNEISRKIFTSIGRGLTTHDYVFWCGDFNYRIDLPIDEVKQLIKEQNWPALIAADQLINQQQQKCVFNSYKEGTLNFAPTYKYDNNSDDYDTSEKSRIPAWTDRVLFRKRYPTTLQEKNKQKLDYGEILFYGRAELKTSDHRPVIAEFKIDVLNVDDEKRSKFFHNVVENLGPPDATVIVREKNDNSDKNEASIFNETYVEQILNTLNSEIGEVILAQFGEDHMRVTFKDGALALKLARLEYIDVMGKRFNFSLKTPNWIDLVEEEVKYGVSNTLPLVANSNHFNIDERNYEMFEVVRSSSPTDSECSIASIGIAPARPPPPVVKQNTNDENKAVNIQPGIKPVRPAPPPPRPQVPRNESVVSVVKEIGDVSFENNWATKDDSFKSDLDQSFNLPPPSLPPPLLSKLAEDDNNKITANFEESFDEDYCPSPSIPPPNIPPPNIPPPNIPPLNIAPTNVSPPNIPSSGGPPPIPSRRPPPMIPPRNT